LAFAVVVVVVVVIKKLALNEGFPQAGVSMLNVLKRFLNCTFPPSNVSAFCLSSHPLADLA
jgi:hypothetical protein